MKSKTRPYISGLFFDGLSSGLFMMALPWVMLATPGMGTFVALVAMVCTASSFFVTPLFSTLIDRHSRKSILVAVQVIQSSTAAGVLVLYTINAESHWWLAGAQLVFWVTNDLAWSANSAFTQENYDRHEYGTISGYQEIVMQTTTLGAGALGVLLLTHWGMMQFALFAAIASGLGALCYLCTPYRRRVRESEASTFASQLVQSKAIFSARPHFYGFLLLSSLSYPVLTFLGKLVPVWFSEQGISGDWFAGFYIAFGVGSLLTGLFIARLLRLASFRHLMQFSMAVIALMLVGMSVSVRPEYLLLFVFGFGFFNALNRISGTNWMHRKVDMSERGRVNGGIAMFAILVQNLSYLLIAVLSHYGLTQYGFWVAAFVVLTAVAMMYLLNRRLQSEMTLVVQNP
ncbi:MFS transporter [Aestuariirhabdus sp. Z084]|uniref:MFS transporter n=1 Tax=Aestuariirhabdus haliotis TaxID=2918751 RepID=UPI00201B416A|nr:MFS transporter [Aestuariirhabdus haliotis]MCL6415818.1 MFS transporter [Aestuariirhabdus haliotis]MCL6419880.1 MFS transporter [Aestuariirhabdus haliotis]